MSVAAQFEHLNRRTGKWSLGFVRKDRIKYSNAKASKEQSKQFVVFEQNYEMN